MGKFGWKGVGVPDFRDFKYRGISPKADVPPVKYLICPPAADQGDLGACVFFALAYAWQEAKIEQGLQPIDPSQLFAYYHYRAKHGSIRDDDGAFIREAIKLMNKDGVCREKTWPYIVSRFARQPPPQAYQEAAGHRVLSYYALNTLDDMLQCLASGFGFVGGLSLFESFESEQVKKTGIAPIPQASEKFLGGHALWFYGYDQHKQVFHFQNSWGTAWGKNGRGTAPFTYLTDPGLCGDIWTIRR